MESALIELATRAPQWLLVVALLMFAFGAIYVFIYPGKGIIVGNGLVGPASLYWKKIAAEKGMTESIPTTDEINDISSKKSVAAKSVMFVIVLSSVISSLIWILWRHDPIPPLNQLGIISVGEVDFQGNVIAPAGAWQKPWGNNVQASISNINKAFTVYFKTPLMKTPYVIVGTRNNEKAYSAVITRVDTKGFDVQTFNANGPERAGFWFLVMQRPD